MWESKGKTTSALKDLPLCMYDSERIDKWSILMVTRGVCVCVLVCVCVSVCLEVKKGRIKSRSVRSDRNLHLYEVFRRTRNICPDSNEHEPPLKQHCVWQSQYVRYHVYCTAVYYVCQSQYVYMTALWLSSLILNSLKDHWRVPLWTLRLWLSEGEE